jgi:hypothetical protein
MTMRMATTAITQAMLNIAAAISQTRTSLHLEGVRQWCFCGKQKLSIFPVGGEA